MSHFTKVKTKIFDKGVLEQALKDLNYQISPVNVVHGFGDAKSADFVINLNKSSKSEIGFTKNKDGSYDMIADWWGVNLTTGKHQDDVNQITQRYAYQKVLVEVKKRGFVIAEEKVQGDNSIKLIVRKWQ